ncbi:hypothetical protein R3P38DRAFT_3212299 [Favolaschia claudopus]|uniref:Uncharacterized protein n=1 Tax=Favolaschia claudopus TaxID=2862362 RepID=A0AAW0AEW4_9AGAR
MVVKTEFGQIQGGTSYSSPPTLALNHRDSFKSRTPHISDFLITYSSVVLTLCGSSNIDQMSPDSSNSKTRSVSTLAAQRAASARYRAKNSERLREEAQERMSRLRATRGDSGRGAEDARTRARAASRKFRQRHAQELAEAQRIRRMSEYKAKHGSAAWEDRWIKIQTQRRAAQEEAELCQYREQWRREDAAQSLASMGGY